MKPMAKNTKHKKAESVAETLCSFSGFLCDIVISVYMIVILMVLPLYNKGYARIGTEKETFFLKTMTYGAKALLPVFLLWLLFRLVTAVQKKELPKFTEWPAGLWKNLSVTDRFAVFYGIAVLVSYLFTNYREEALWGTASWRMGMWTQLGAVIVYFMISRMWQWKSWIPALVLPVSAVVFSLGYVNKFGLLPVDPEYVNPSFISTIGNINWYCGYLVTILFGGVYLLWRMEEMTWKKLLLMAYVTIGFASLATQGSSSGIVTFAVAMFVLFGMSVRDSGRMEVFWQEMTMFSAACLITCVLRRLNIFSRELILEGITDLLTFSIAGIFMTILSGIILYWIHRTRVRRSYPEKLLHRIYCGIAIAVPVMILLVLLLTLINTVTGGALTPGITDPEVIKWLTFNVSWGSARGGTWAAGARCFWEADFLHKIFGVGPDCLYAFLSNEGSVGLQTMVNDRFGGNRLTNAHNEWLTTLINLGVLGTTAYAAVFLTALRKYRRNSMAIMLLFTYGMHSLISFQQVLNTPFFFLLLGVCEAEQRMNQQDNTDTHEESIEVG